MIRKTFKFLFIVAIFISTFVKNSDASMLVSKTYIILDTDHRSDILQVTNLSDKKMRYKTKLIHYKQLENGDYKNIEGATESKDMIADNLVYMSPRSFVLEPKETQTIRIMRKNFNSGNLKDLPNGEYRSHLIVAEDSEVKDAYNLEEIKNSQYESSKGGLSIKIVGLMGTSIPLIVRKGDLTTSGSIAGFEFFSNSNGEPFIKVEIARSGEKSIRGDMQVTADGKQIANVKNVAVYTSTSKRYINIPLNLNFEDKTPLGVKNALKELGNKKIEIKYVDVEEENNALIASYKSQNSVK
jgi:hypothetical protein